ncbi:MAG: HlyC/CorC family transporter [Clostridiales bacterium]|nr:HlyC/CorC family transporter [Clostridiales bacterium]
MTPDLWILVAILFVCVALSAFFSASETAFTSVNRVKLKTLMQNGSKRAKLALTLTDDYDRLITTILIGNNIVNIAASSLATSLFLVLLNNQANLATTVSTVVMTVVILIFGEVSPKAIAKESPESLAMTFSPVLRMLCTIFTPFAVLFTLLKKMLTKVIKTSEEEESFIEEELMTMVDEAQSEGDMDAHEGELIRSAIEFNDDRDVISILTPRVDVTAIEDTATMEEAAELFRASGYSRVPVYHEDMDHIVGILNEKDFYLQKHHGCTDITEIMKPPVYAPTTLKLSKLLKLIQAQKTHLIIVLDEFGGTEGIVTMEDVLEELVGEIYDEHDDVEQDTVEMDDGSRLVDGSMQLSELLDMFGVEDIYNAETVGGFAAEVLGIIPFVGSVFETDEIRGLVTQMDKRRVMQVRVWKKEAPMSGASEDA